MTFEVGNIFFFFFGKNFLYKILIKELVKHRQRILEQFWKTSFVGIPQEIGLRRM